MSNPRFQRANFLVADLEQSLAFYQDVLGLEVAFIKDSEADSYSYDVFEIPRDRKMRFAVLSSASQPRVMALTEIGAMDAPGLPRRSAIVVETPDIDKVVAGSRQLGLKVYEEDHLVTQDGREGREVGIVDTDGNLVVIYHITQKAPDS
jgi:catechol 2,3-dioxygenase-like lactoylglutathione lyase family enzyme